MSDVVSTDHTVPHQHLPYNFNEFAFALQANLDDLLTASRQSSLKFNDGHIRLGRSAVSGDTLYELYLDSFPTAESRQHHTCSCCRQFFRNYGNLVILLPSGETGSLFFSDSEVVPAEFREFVLTAQKTLRNTKIDELFYSQSSAREFSVGTKEAGGFHHFYFLLHGILPRPNRVQTAHQNAAEANTDLELLTKSMGTWSDTTLKSGAALFEHHEFLRTLHFAEIIPSFIDVRANYRAIKHHAVRHNYLLGVVSDSRKGLARIGQTNVGDFLTNLEEGKSEAYVVRAFLERVDSKLYLRPVAAPTAGAVAEAEKIFASLDLADSLRRRALRRDELKVKLWEKPAITEEKGPGVFSHLDTKDGKTNQAAKSTINGGAISLAKLMTLLSTAEKIEVRLPGMSYELSSLVTEAVEGSKPILRWDNPDQRNPVSSYRYAQAVHPSTWGLPANVWEEVIAVVPDPKDWFRPNPNETGLFLFVLARGYDQGNAQALPLFPETLRNELHPVRSVIEAFARQARLENIEQGLVCWNYFTASHTVSNVRLTTKDAIVLYSVVSAS